MKKSVKILIIILCLIIVGLIAFIIVDKVVNKDKNEEIENEENSTVVAENEVESTENTANNLVEENSINSTNENSNKSSMIENAKVNEESSSNIESTRSEYDIYMDYINNKKYNANTTDWPSEISAGSYCIFDINKDGIKELLIMGSDESGWKFTLVYTYNKSNNSVIFIDNIYSYGEIKYDNSNSEIVYAEVKPTVTERGYGAYKLENGKLTSSKSMIQEGEEYFIYIGDEQQECTAEEYEEYIGKLTNFEFTNI